MSPDIPEPWFLHLSNGDDVYADSYTLRVVLTHSSALYTSSCSVLSLPLCLSPSISLAPSHFRESGAQVQGSYRVLCIMQKHSILPHPQRPCPHPCSAWNQCPGSYRA
jgi:hypothetical protein